MSSDPRDLVGSGAGNPMTPAVPTPLKKPSADVKGKKKAAPSPKLKTQIRPLPVNLPKPNVPKGLTAVAPSGDPQVNPKNSPKGIKQQMGLNVPGMKLR